MIRLGLYFSYFPESHSLVTKNNITFLLALIFRSLTPEENIFSDGFFAAKRRMKLEASSDYFWIGRNRRRKSIMTRKLIARKVNFTIKGEERYTEIQGLL